MIDPLWRANSDLASHPQLFLAESWQWSFLDQKRMAPAKRGSVSTSGWILESWSGAGSSKVDMLMAHPSRHVQFEPVSIPR